MKLSRYLAFIALLTACQAATRHPDGKVPVPANLTQVLSSNAVPGFQHSFASSEFAIGAVQSTINENGWAKVIGSNGVFATNLNTGAVRAVPNGDSPASQLPALTGDPDVHSAHVLAYFEAAGLPSDQVAAVHVTTMMGGGGLGPPPVGFRGNFIAYNSVIGRAINGITVADSFAWARFNNQGQVMAEAAYWPPIPASVVNDALTLQAQFGAPTAMTTFVAALPVKAIDAGRVVIHHTYSASRGIFAAVACVDIDEYTSALNHRGRTRHFDGSANELDLSAFYRVEAPTAGSQGK